MTPGFLTSPARIVRRAVGYPRVRQHLSEQDTTAAELRLALDAGILALDQRLLDLYALTETARREFQERILALSALTEAARAESQRQAASIEETLAAPESPLAELISAEAGRIDSYLVHHVTKLRKDLALDQAPVRRSPPMSTSYSPTRDSTSRCRASSAISWLHDRTRPCDREPWNARPGRARITPRSAGGGRLRVDRAARPGDGRERRCRTARWSASSRCRALRSACAARLY